MEHTEEYGICDFCGAELPCRKCDHEEERGEIEAQEDSEGGL